MKNLLITASVFFGMCFIYVLIMLSETENHFTYILDDAYIHLALAKNFALHGVWGVTEYVYSSSSSSPLFTFLLSGLIYIFGNHQLIPLLFNFGCAFLIVYVLSKYYSNLFKGNTVVILTSLFTLLFASVHLLVFSGMEHVLQVLVIVINIYCFEKWRAAGFSNSSYSVCFYSTIALLGLIRFESMFYFVALAFVFLLLGKWKQSTVLLLCGFIPIGIFGYFTHQETGYYFPNSVIVKGVKLDFSGNYLVQIKNIFLNKLVLKPYFHLAALPPICFVFFFLYKDYKNKSSFRETVLHNFLLIVLGITLLVQAAFGQFTNFYRYEAYLLTAFSMLIIPRVKNVFSGGAVRVRQNKTAILLILFTFTVLALKMVLVSILIITGSRNIYEQQIQSAGFLKQYYNSSKVIANDIGAVCYFTDIHLLDIAGLGSKEAVPFKVKKNGMNDEFETFLTAYTAQNHYQLAIIYEEWLEGHVPANWRKAAVLEIQGRNAVLGLNTVTIYSVDPEIHNSLQQNVKNFHWNKNVVVRILK